MDKYRKVGVGFGVMILKDGEVLLGLRNSDPKKASSALHGEGTWTMPGGKLDYGERLSEGACREIFEETGLKVNQEDLRLTSLTDNIAKDVHFVTVGFLCTTFEGEPAVMEPEEITEWKWFPLTSLPKNMYPASLEVVQNYQDKRIYKS